MKKPSLESYKENASSNDGNKPQMVGVYRGSSLDKQMYAKRQSPTLVKAVGKK
jgi:hypothetical protein